MTFDKRRSVRNITISQLLYEIKNFSIADINASELICDSIPSELILDKNMNKLEQSKQFKRVKDLNNL